MGNDPGSIPMDDPLAFFLTWTTYGSWLPGDERGWVEKPGRFRDPDAKREHAARERMAEPELTLDTQQRDIVEKTIAEHCRIRNWQLHAVNCRTQHVHVVVTAPNRDPEDVMDQFKAWCTRRLKAHANPKLKPEAPAKRREAEAAAKDCAAEERAKRREPILQAKDENERAFAGASGFNEENGRQKWWTQRGSHRRLYNEASLEAAICYVLEAQGDRPLESTLDN